MSGVHSGVNRKLLRIYLQDHHAASAAGLNLVRRLARENAATPFAGDLAELAEEIAVDRAELRTVLRELGVEPSRVKIALARSAERLSRLKLNGRLLDYSPLSRLIELETLSAGIEAKRGLWQALRQAVDGQLGVDLDRLTGRAETQIASVERLRKHAAQLAFATKAEP
jgi:hypothetical protein